MNKWMTAKSAVALVVILSFLGTTGCSASSTQLLDVAVAAADAAVAALSASAVIPAQDDAYVTAVLDGLTFATQELASKKTPAQIATDIANEFKNIILPDLTGLTPQQVVDMKALAAAIAAFIAPFESLAAQSQAGSPAVTMFPVSFQLTFMERVHLLSVRRHISSLKKTMEAIITR